MREQPASSGLPHRILQTLSGPKSRCLCGCNPDRLSRAGIPPRALLTMLRLERSEAGDLHPLSVRLQSANFRAMLSADMVKPEDKGFTAKKF